MTRPPPGLVAADMTWREAARALTQSFRADGFDAPELEARFLLQGVLQVDGVRLLTDGAALLGGRAAAVREALARRLAGEPLARILGEREFYGRTFAVTRDVLDPRADTETIVDLGLEMAQGAPLQLADIGTGTGIILLTLLAERPDATGVGTDVSAAALDVAQANATALGLAGRARFCQGGGLTGLAADAAAALTLVVSNPPYIPTATIASLDRAVRDYDPHLALDGGPDGLDVYRELSNDFIALKPGCAVVLEIGAGQLADVSAIMQPVLGAKIAVRHDLAGVPRAVAFRKH